MSQGKHQLGGEQPGTAGADGAFLRPEGLYSSLMSEWRRARDAGLSQGKPAGEAVGRPEPASAEPLVRPRPVPANAFTPAEREQVLRLRDSPQFVDAAPAQIYTARLDQGVYVASIAAMCRILCEPRQLRERRRLARHPARARPARRAH